MEDFTKMRTWAQVDLNALAHNYHALRALTPAGCKFLGLVKANAYGHGAVPVAKKLETLGCDMLAVACLAEAAQLRDAGITLPILCLGYTPAEQTDLLLKYRVTQTVGDLETGRALSDAAQRAGGVLDIHVKLDTGMGRIGFLWQLDGDNTAVADHISALCALPGLRAGGMFTHFSDADGSEAYTEEQLHRFQDARTTLAQRGVTFPLYHCGASAATLRYACTHMDMVRPGIALYGYSPAPDMPLPHGLELRPVMTVKSRVYVVRELPVGSCVSYGRTATLARDSRLAVVPIGYGDGFPRLLSNRMELIVHGVPCPIVGRICMDMCMIDVTDVPDVKTGDEVLVYGPGQTERAAQAIGTIVYELLCDLTPRIPRVYVDGPET